MKAEFLSRPILFGESTLSKAVTNFVDHYHRERNHQGKANVLLFGCGYSTGGFWRWPHSLQRTARRTAEVLYREAA
jgi:hypothetical protein